MANENEVVVIVSMKNNKIEFRLKEPREDGDNGEWVNLFWQDNPHTGRAKKTAIRWTFEGIDPKVTSTDVKLLKTVPSKYVDSVPNFLAKPIFAGVRHVPPSGESDLEDIITVGHEQRKGWFCYSLHLYKENGEPFAEADPGGTNDPTEPPGDHG
jgi:hypothetical protein